MIRGDNLICGTTTTGTGTLTLAATPVPPGGIDFDVFCRATGIGFGNSAAILVTYTIIEYTDSTFATAKQHEKGVGTLTLGGSSGIANATLARTTLQTSATSLNSPPATQNIAPGAGITIGTAANTLVFIGASTCDTLVGTPYFDSSLSAFGVAPYGVDGNSWNGSGNFASSGSDLYFPFFWTTPLLVKRAYIKVQNSTTGTNTAFFRIYDVGTNGRPSKLLIDLGALGGANPLNATGIISTALAANGFYLMPGVYFANIFATYTGTPAPGFGSTYGGGLGPSLVGDGGTANQYIRCTSATGGSSTAPDPANVAGYNVASAGLTQPVFGLNNT